MNNRRAFNDTILHKARRGLVVAALFIFATTAGATWLASDQAQARPVKIAKATDGATQARKAAQAERQGRPIRVAEASDDGKLTKNGKVLSGKLNINSATEEELRMLPGIGPKKAQRILDYRAKHGKFKRVRDLRRVKGFGYKTVKKLSPYLTIQGKSTLQAE